MCTILHIIGPWILDTRLSLLYIILLTLFPNSRSHCSPGLRVVTIISICVQLICWAKAIKFLILISGYRIVQQWEAIAGPLSITSFICLLNLRFIIGDCQQTMVIFHKCFYIYEYGSKNKTDSYFKQAKERHCDCFQCITELKFKNVGEEHSF